MIFANPQYLMALAALPLMALLLLLVRLRKRKVMSGMGEPALLGRLSETYSADRRAIKAVLALAALGCALLAAARPQVGLQITRGTARGIDLVVALDVSASMLARDVKPSRIERAKVELAALISSLEGSRVGIIAFAGSALPTCPLTSDSRAARMFLDALRHGVVEDPGTDIGEAISRALGSFDSAEERSRAILIVSDGEDHEGGFSEAVGRAVEAGVPVYCVGVGGDEGVPIPAGPEGSNAGFRKDSEGEIVLTRMNGEILREVALASNGSMHVLGPSGGNIRALAADIRKLPMRERPTTYTHRGERFHIAVLIALFLLALDWFVGDRRRVAAASAAILVVIGTILAPAPGAASSANDAVRLYNKGDYLGALARFREALAEDPSAPLYYDAGNSLYRLDKFEEAARHYAGSIAGADSVLRRNARYNTGNCLFKSGDMQGAVANYIEALKMDPNDEDSKHNLEVATRMLQESQKSQQSGGGDDGEQKDESQAKENGGRQGENKPEERNGQGSEGRQGEDRPEQDAEQHPQESPAGAEEEQSTRFSKEEAERLLEALAGDEKDLLSKRMKAKVRRKGGKKNW